VLKVLTAFMCWVHLGCIRFVVVQLHFAIAAQGFQSFGPVSVQCEWQRWRP